MQKAAKCLEDKRRFFGRKNIHDTHRVYVYYLS